MADISKLEQQANLLFDNVAGWENSTLWCREKNISQFTVYWWIREKGIKYAEQRLSEIA